MNAYTEIYAGAATKLPQHIQLIEQNRSDRNIADLVVALLERHLPASLDGADMWYWVMTGTRQISEYLEVSKPEANQLVLRKLAQMIGLQ